MARAKFRASYEGIGRILRSEQMQHAMKARADRLKAICEADAPRETGAYAASFRVVVYVREGKTRRAVAKLVNDDEAAVYVEYGTSRTPRYRVMGRAAGSA